MKLLVDGTVGSDPEREEGNSVPAKKSKRALQRIEEVLLCPPSVIRRPLFLAIETELRGMREELSERGT